MVDGYAVTKLRLYSLHVELIILIYLINTISVVSFRNNQLELISISLI